MFSIFTISPSPIFQSPPSTQQSPQPPASNPSNKPTNPSNLVYYPQCDGNYDNLAMGSCTFCKSGCGIATASMILSSYVDKSFTPDATLKLYQQQGLEADCNGSSIFDAKQILSEKGVLTSDVIYYNEQKSDVVAQDLKNYTDAGWTIFMLGEYCASGCKHFFWITNVDGNNNIWAYDPYYGRYQIPFKENSYYPYPLYKIAFAVKKE